MSKYIPQKIGDMSLPGAFSTQILMRAFKESEMKSLYESYRNSKKTSGRREPPSDLQFKIAKDIRSGKSTKEVSSKLHVRLDQVYGAVNRVAVWEFYNPSK